MTFQSTLMPIEQMFSDSLAAAAGRDFKTYVTSYGKTVCRAKFMKTTRE